MAKDLEQAVAQRYGAADLSERILKAITAAGLDPDRLTPEQLAPVDEFHIGGRAATIHAVAKMGLTSDNHVLDVGCGIGGATRYLAATAGCAVTGIDLTPAYIAAAEELTRRTGLADRVTYGVASALAMPFENGTFDAAITFHVAMNIKDRPALYREVARVLKPGALFCSYDVMKGGSDDLPCSLGRDARHQPPDHTAGDAGAAPRCGIRGHRGGGPDGLRHRVFPPGPRQGCDESNVARPPHRDGRHRAGEVPEHAGQPGERRHRPDGHDRQACRLTPRAIALPLAGEAFAPGFALARPYPLSLDGVRPLTSKVEI
jgi:SAM-dependent methyltransferase